MSLPMATDKHPHPPKVRGSAFCGTVTRVGSWDGIWRIGVNVASHGDLTVEYML
jgi:threonine dehydrogenase-like Zn-dependent dehydrogenase